MFPINHVGRGCGGGPGTIRKALIMRKLAIFACVLAAAALVGCKSKDEGTPAGNTAAKSPKSTPKATPKPSPSPDTRTSQRQHANPAAAISDARTRLASELHLLRAYRWTSRPTPQVLTAAQKVFGPGDPRGGVPFVGMTEAQVKSLVGNPREKKAQGDQVVWVYSYAHPNSTLGLNLCFKDHQVTDVARVN